MRLAHFKWFGLVILLIASTLTFAQEIWYEDSNFGKGGVLPDDFVYKFKQPESWSAARSKLDVYLFRANIFNANYPELNDGFIANHMIPVLRGDQVKVALNTAAPLLSGCKDHTSRMKAELEWIVRIKRLGMDVQYLSLQSLLSKPNREELEVLDCPVGDRVSGGIDYAKKVARIYPGVEIGLIDALPSHGKPYKEAYKYARDMFQSQGVPLKYIHLDVSFEMITRGVNGLSWKKIIEVERYVKKLGLKFGLVFTSRKAGFTSDEAFYKAVVSELEEYRGAGGDPDHYVIASWFPHPQQTIRRLDAKNRGYPITDAILEFDARIAKPARKKEMRRINQ